MLCAATKVLAIPEVVILILDNDCLSRSDFAGFSQVCRYTAEVTVPFLWRTATAEGLLQLIKSTEIHRWPSGRARTFCLASYPGDHTLFEKFHFYAQYVKTLEVYDRQSRCCYTVDGWGTLWTETKAKKAPLLPNIKALRFLNLSNSHGIDELKWLETFATPRLKEVSLTPVLIKNTSDPSPGESIPFPVTSIIVQRLITLCADIQILELASNDDLLYMDPPDAAEFGDLLFHAALEYRSTVARPWYQWLFALPKLRHLTVSAGWFYPACLRALGYLTELESLTIVPGSLNGFDPESDIYSRLPDTVFPRLTQLTLLGNEIFATGSFLSVGGILHHVTTIKLEFYFDYYMGGDRHTEIERIFHGLRNANSLRDLRIDFDFQPEYDGYPANASGAIDEMGLHTLLEFVHLGGIHISKEFRRDPNFMSIRYLRPVWPNVQVLSMPSQSASVRELEDFAALPSLLDLTLNLDLKYPYLPTKPSFPRAPLKTLISSGPVRLSTDYDDLLLSAAALLRLWPSLERVSWSDNDPTRTQLADFFNSEVLYHTRKSMFGRPRADAQLIAGNRLKELEGLFEEMIEDVEETDGWNSDSDWESASD